MKQNKLSSAGFIVGSLLFIRIIITSLLSQCPCSHWLGAMQPSCILALYLILNNYYRRYILLWDHAAYQTSTFTVSDWNIVLKNYVNRSLLNIDLSHRRLFCTAKIRYVSENYLKFWTINRKHGGYSHAEYGFSVRLYMQYFTQK